MNNRSTLLLTASAVAVLLLPTRGRAAESAISPLPPDGTYYGLKMTDWAVAWFEWIQNIPQSSSPDMSFDKTGIRGGVGQHGPVWFTPGYLGGGSNATRSYTVPAGKAILLPLGAALEFDVPGKKTDEQLLAAVNKDFPDSTKLGPVSLDGVTMPDSSQYIFTTTVFTNVLPPGNIFGVTISAGRDPRIAAIGKGGWTLFPPLPVGKHVFQHRDPIYGGWTLNVSIANPNDALP
jgi:hypothetical protein